MNQEVYQTVIRVNKEDSAFIYFQLEANEGVCFYSTLKESLGEPYRDIKVTAHISLAEETKRILNILSSKLSIKTVS